MPPFVISCNERQHRKAQGGQMNEGEKNLLVLSSRFSHRLHAGVCIPPTIKRAQQLNAVFVLHTLYSYVQGESLPSQFKLANQVEWRHRQVYKKNIYINLLLSSLFNRSINTSKKNRLFLNPSVFNFMSPHTCYPIKPKVHFLRLHKQSLRTNSHPLSHFKE